VSRLPKDCPEYLDSTCRALSLNETKFLSTFRCLRCHDSRAFHRKRAVVSIHSPRRRSRRVAKPRPPAPARVQPLLCSPADRRRETRRRRRSCEGAAPAKKEGGRKYAFGCRRLGARASVLRDCTDRAVLLGVVRIGGCGVMQVAESDAAVVRSRGPLLLASLWNRCAQVAVEIGSFSLFMSGVPLKLIVVATPGEYARTRHMPGSGSLTKWPGLAACSE